MKEDDIQYAIENTRVLMAPSRRIETFGSTQFRFHLVTELMDSAGVVRVRDGRIEAEQPRILSPMQCKKLMLEGFGEKARRFADWLEGRQENAKLLQYGFQMRKTELVEETVRAPMEEVIARIRGQINASAEPLSAIIEGVDDAWEVCLLKFTFDLIQNSAGGNMRDFHQRGLL